MPGWDAAGGPPADQAGQASTRLSDCRRRRGRDVAAHGGAVHARRGRAAGVQPRADLRRRKRGLAGLDCRVVAHAADDGGSPRGRRASRRENAQAEAPRQAARRRRRGRGGGAAERSRRSGGVRPEPGADDDARLRRRRRRSLAEALQVAQQAGDDRRVLGTETRPGCEGRSEAGRPDGGSAGQAGGHRRRAADRPRRRTPGRRARRHRHRDAARRSGSPAALCGREAEDRSHGRAGRRERRKRRRTTGPSPRPSRRGIRPRPCGRSGS